MAKPPPRVLTIAGSDPSGGAGLQADIKTITLLGGYAMSAVTAITVQNTYGVSAVEVLPPTTVTAQIEACWADIGVDAIKIGMLGSAAVAHAVADALQGLSVPIVFDPVMIATSGGILADADTVRAFDRLMQIATLVTPNLPELEALSGHTNVADEFSMAEAAKALIERTGAPAVLAKGGHWPGGFLYGSDVKGQRLEAKTEDLLFDCLYTLSPTAGWQEWAFHHPRVETRHTHGTGCTMASAIAVGLGRGQSLADCVRDAGDFVYRALRAAPGFGGGAGPIGLFVKG